MVTSTFAHGANLTSPEQPLFFFLKGVLFLFYVLECFAGMYAYAPYTCSAHRDQKRAIDPLELELRDNGFSLHAGAGNLNPDPL